MRTRMHASPKIGALTAGLIGSFIKNVLVNHIIQMSNNFTARVQSTRHQHAQMMTDCRATGQSQPR